MNSSPSDPGASQRAGGQLDTALVAGSRAVSGLIRPASRGGAAQARRAGAQAAPGGEGEGDGGVPHRPVSRARTRLCVISPATLESVQPPGAGHNSVLPWHDRFRRSLGSGDCSTRSYVLLSRSEGRPAYDE